MVEHIVKAYLGQRAKDDVGAISRYHRIQASPGYRGAASYVFGELQNAGLEATLESFPANYETRFWTSRSFQEWDCARATLQLIEPAEEAQLLADFDELKLAIIQRSASFEGEAEVVILEGDLQEADYEALDLAGKIVLTDGAGPGSVERVRQLAVERHGAVGIIFDGMSAAPPVREAMDLPDARQYTSFWWSGSPEQKQCFGFVLSPRQGEKLRRLIRLRQTAGESPIKVRAEVDARFYDGDMEVVTAVIRGQSQETVVLVSHLCHPQPSANDNASGAAANLEAARTLQRLIASGELPQPKRTIRFLWMPEMTGSFAYLSRHEDEIPNMVAGLNLDMVGEDQAQTGSVLLLEKPPEAVASFAPTLLVRLREMIYDDVNNYSGIGQYSLQRYATTGFSGGSDHYVFSDPTVGVPMPMLIQWPDKFYHTSADTLDKVSVESLTKAGSLAAAYAYFIASADQDEASWLAHEMLVHFREKLSQITQNTILAIWEDEAAEKAYKELNRLERLVAFHLDRHRVALQGLIRLCGIASSLSDMMYYDAARFANQELGRARRLAEQHLGVAALENVRESSEKLDEWEQRAAEMKPHRLYRGPASTMGALQSLSAEELADWFKLLTSRKTGGFTVPVLAEYWADGRRSALEIVDLVEMETGIRDAELIVRRFELLQRLALVEL
jgi:hypothetical protein